MMRNNRVAVGLIAFALVAAFGIALSLDETLAEPLKIRMAHGVSPPHLTPLIYQKKNLMKHYGKSYTVELMFTSSTSVQVSMLAAKEIDIAWFSFTSFATSIVNANLDIRAVSDVIQFGAPEYFSGVFAVLKNSKIRDIKDLKGKRIGVPGLGTALEMSARIMLRKIGYEANRDYALVEVNFPNMKAMLDQGMIASGIVIPPWWYIPKIRQDLRPLFTPDQSMGRIQAVFHVARTDFLKKNHAAVQEFFEDYLRVWRWFLDPKNRDEALDIMSRVAKQPRKNFEPWVLQKGTDYYRDPDGRVNSAALQNNINVMRELGYLKKELNVKPYIDMSYIEEARRRLAEP